MKRKHQQVFDDVRNIVNPTPAIVKLTKRRLASPIPYHLFVGKNRKLGNRIASWSTLMGDYKYNMPPPFQGIIGTCGGCCAGCKQKCYVRHSYFQPSVILGHTINTWGLRHEPWKVREDIAEQLAKGKIDIVRINQSGEVENVFQFAMWCELAKRFPDVKFYIYTKNYMVAEAFLVGDQVAPNFTVNYSIWHDYGVGEYRRVMGHPNVKAFVYDDGYPISLKVDAVCPAYKRGPTGKVTLDHNITCEKCKLCFDSMVHVTSCIDH